MDRLLMDLRLALRRLRQSSGFTIVAVLTLALGIGANTAVFSVINEVALRPLPVAHGSELVSLNQVMAGAAYPTVSFPDFRDIRDRNNVLSGLTAYRIVPASLGLAGNNQRLWGYLVTGNYFDVLGVDAVRGRLLTPSDDLHPGAHPVAVISYSCWQQRFGGDPAIAGRSANLNGMRFTILGVTPRGFIGTELFFAPEAYFPMMMEQQIEGASYFDTRDAHNFFSVGRRKPGVSMAQAEAGINAIGRQLSEEFPKTDAGMKMVLSVPGLAGGYLRGPVVGFAAALFGVSCLVLLVACTNIATMLLARAVDQRKQTAIRLALGAARGRLIRQLLTESLMVALAGGAAGAILAQWMVDALRSWRPPFDFPLVVTAPLDWRVFLFTLIISAAATLLFGLVPAVQATKADLLSALKSDAISERFRHWQLRDYLVGAQVALSVLLMVCSVLVVRSLQRVLQAPIGYQPAGAVAASFDLNIQGYDETRGREFEQRLLEKVRSLPGIESAALANYLPLTLDTSSDGIQVEGQPKLKPTEMPLANSFVVSSDYFRTMRSSLLMGREFDARDKKGAKPVAVVNQAFARKILRSDQPLGMRFSVSSDADPIQVVGVVEDGKYFSLNENHAPAYWAPLEIFHSQAATLVARTRLKPAEAFGLIRRAAAELDPGLSLYSVATLTDRLGVAFFPSRLAAGALGAFGVLAGILAAIGIYGVMAYAVSRRTREIGIRMAIGADWSEIIAIVGRRAAILVGGGTAIGLAMALLGGQLLGTMLYGIEPTDPLTFATVFAVIVAIGSAACWIPARRAVRIDPVVALRQE